VAEAGRKHTEQKALRASKAAKSVRVLHFPELQEKGDVSDWLPSHSVQELLDRMASAEVWVPEVEASEATIDPAHADQSFKLPLGYPYKRSHMVALRPTKNHGERPAVYVVARRKMNGHLVSVHHERERNRCSSPTK
jgi:hypothetical protein